MVKTKIALVKPFLRDCCFEEAGQCITHATRSECTFRLDPHSPPIGPPSPTPSYSPPPSSPKWSVVHTCIHPKLKQQEGTLPPIGTPNWALHPSFPPHPLPIGHQCMLASIPINSNNSRKDEDEDDNSDNNNKDNDNI